jgi:hypothetical protein
VLAEGTVRSVGLIIALTIASWPQTSAAQSVPLTNIEIRMLKTSTRPPLRITADTRNPNDFAVRDVEVDCTIKDKAGKDLASYSSTIFSVLPANHRMTTRSLNIGAWPEQGYAGLCISKRAVRVQSPTAAPSAPAPQGPLPTAPAAQQPSAAAPETQPANARP